MTLWSRAHPTELSVQFVLGDEMKRSAGIQPQLGIGDDPPSFHLSQNRPTCRTSAVPDDLRAPSRAPRSFAARAPSRSDPMLGAIDPASLTPEVFAQMLGMTACPAWVCRTRWPRSIICSRRCARDARAIADGIRERLFLSV
jgi:hypothetical protein